MASVGGACGLKGLWWLKWLKRPDVPEPFRIEGAPIMAIPEEPAVQPVDYHEERIEQTDTKPIEDVEI